MGEDIGRVGWILYGGILFAKMHAYRKIGLNCMVGWYALMHWYSAELWFSKGGSEALVDLFQ